MKKTVVESILCEYCDNCNGLKNQLFTHRTLYPVVFGLYTL